MAISNLAIGKVPGMVRSTEIMMQGRLIVAVDGLEKAGKTHFALTAPAPVAVISFDIGLEGVINKFNDKEIWVKEYRIPKGKVDGDASTIVAPILADLKSTYYSILERSTARTLIIDTASEMWELVRLARFGKLTQVKPHHYGPVNAEYREMIRAAYDHDKNLILLHKLKSEYVNDKRTGGYSRSGMNETGFLVQVNLRTERDGSEFWVEIEDCRHDPGLNGEILEGGLCNFTMLANMVMPEMEWE